MRGSVASAAAIASMSKPRSSAIGTLVTRAPAANGSISCRPKLGVTVTTSQPGASAARAIAAIISSEPLPTTIRSAVVVSLSASAVRSSVQAGSA